MRAFKIFPVILLSAMLGGPIVLTANLAYARCCMCGNCGAGCTCPGTYPCGWCAAPIPEQLQITAAFSDRTPNEAVVQEESISSLAIDSRRIDRLIILAGTGQCGRSVSRLAFIEGYKPIIIDNDISQNAIQVDAVQARFP